MNFRKFPISVKNILGILAGIALSLWIAFVKIVVFTILILPVYEHEVPFHL